MSVFRFLHVADVHLDAPFGVRGEKTRALLRRASEDSFARAVTVAVEEKVDAFLVAGDLFDTPDPSVKAETFLLRQVRRLGDAGIPFLYATGNHDPLAAGAAGRAIEWPPNTVLFETGAPRRVEVKDREGRVVGAVTGAGHEIAAVGENLAARFPARAGSLPEVALLHASVEGSTTAPDHDRYAPCAAADFRGKGYAYWALGHIHKREKIADDPPVHYPGSLFGRSRKETGPKGALLVEASTGVPAKARFVPTAAVTWEEVRVDVSGAKSLEALRRRVVAGLAAAALPKGALLTLHLEGETVLRESLRVGDALDDFGDELRGESDLGDLDLRAGWLRPPFDADEARVGAVETMIDLVEGLRSGRESFAPVAPQPCAWSCGERDEERARYLRGLLDGAEEEVARRMNKDGR